jgi:hypothetical protein
MLCVLCIVSIRLVDDGRIEPWMPMSLMLMLMRIEMEWRKKGVNSRGEKRT